jgi:hypothetical protein
MKIKKIPKFHVFTLGCLKKYDNMRAPNFPVLLGSLNKNIKIKTFSDEDFSKM